MSYLALCVLALAAQETPRPPVANYTHVGAFKVIGWRDAGRYFLCDTELSSGALGATVRIALDANTGNAAWQWKQEDESSDPALDKQSAAWMKKHPASKPGKVVWHRKAGYFEADKSIPAAEFDRATVTFTHNRASYTVKLEQSFNSKAESGDQYLDLHRSKIAVSVRKGTGAWKVIYHDRDFARASLANGLQQIQISPDGKGFAVMTVSYNFAVFEGLNYIATFLPVVGRLP